MAGWLADFHVLKSYWDDWATMKFNTGLAMVLLAVGLILQLSDSDRRIHIAAAALHTLAMLIGILTSLEYLAGLDLGIDQLFVSGAEPNASYPLGRMAGATAFLFSILPAACLLSNVCMDGAQRLARALNLTGLGIAFFIIFGYGSGPQPIYDVFLFRSVALPTALSFGILNLTALMLRPRQMPASVVCDSGIAGTAVRGAVPWLVAAPLVIAVLAELGLLAGLYDNLVAHKLIVLVIIVAGIMTILRSGVILRRLDKRREAAETKLRQSHAQLEQRVDRRTAELREAIQELRALKKDADAARQSAENASKAKSDFLSSMSHELRTPLNAVIGFGQLLQTDRDRCLSAKQQEYCHHIIGAGNHLLNLVNEILDLAGIEAGRLKMSLERVSVTETFDSIRRTMLPLAEKNDIRLEVSLPADIPDVHADQLRLHQVLLNLVSNGIKYNRAGGKVELAAELLPSGRVRMRISDTGIGIDPTKQDKLFEPFERLGAEYTGVEGTGIGLTLSRNLVNAMHGTLGYSSSRNQGSTFWVDLPAESPATPLIRTGAAASAGAGPAAAGGYALLYVEDNPINLKLMEDLVATLPDVVMLCAPSGQLGLDLAVAHRPDVIVLDLNLPGLSGFEVLSRLKTMPQTVDIPVIALTASAFAKDRKRGLAAGLFRYLTKPIDIDAFLTAVGDALGRTAGPSAANAG